MPENAIIPDGVIPAEEAIPETAKAETAKEKFERERLSRRQALKKMAIEALERRALFALFSVDDLARMVGKAMQQRAADNKIAERIAEELHSTGVAQAAYGVQEILLNCARYGVNCPNCCAQVKDICTGLGYDFATCTAAQLNCVSTCLMD